MKKGSSNFAVTVSRAVIVVLVALLALGSLMSVKIDSDDKLITDAFLLSYLNAAEGKALMELDKNSGLKGDEYDEKREDIKEKYDDLMNFVSGKNEDGENTEVSVNIDPIGFIGSIGGVFNGINYFITDIRLANAARNGKSEQIEKLGEKLVKDVDPSMVSKDSIGVLMVMSKNVLGFDIASAFKDSGIGILISLVIGVLRIAFAVAVWIVMPVALLIGALKLLLGVLKNKKDRDMLESISAARFSKVVEWMAMLIGAVIICSAELTVLGAVFAVIIFAMIIADMVAATVKIRSEEGKRVAKTEYISMGIVAITLAAVIFTFWKSGVISYYADGSAGAAIFEKYGDKIPKLVLLGTVIMSGVNLFICKHLVSCAIGIFSKTTRPSAGMIGHIIFMIANVVVILAGGGKFGAMTVCLIASAVFAILLIVAGISYAAKVAANIGESDEADFLLLRYDAALDSKKKEKRSSKKDGSDGEAKESDDDIESELDKIMSEIEKEEEEKEKAGKK